MSVLQIAPRPINNQQLPGDGPKMIRVNMNFASVSSLNWDLSTLTQRGFISQIQTAYIDNGNNASSLTISFGSPVAQVITVPAYTQGFYPVLAPDNTLQAQTSGAVPVYINLINVPIAPSHWTVNSGTSSYDGAGNLKTTDSNLGGAFVQGGNALNVNSVPFAANGNGSLIAASTVSANVAITNPAAPVLQVTNESSSPAWLNFGTSNAVTAVFPTGTTQPGVMIPANSVKTIASPPGQTYVAAILRTGTGNITIVPGTGA